MSTTSSPVTTTAHPHTSRPPRKHKGQYLILAIIALILFVAALAYGMKKFQASQVSQKASQGVGNFTTMSNKIAAEFGNDPTGYGGVTTQTIAQAQAVPASQLTGGTPPSGINSAFGLPMTFAANTDNSDYLDITTDVPQNACVTYAQGLASQVHALTVGGTTIVDDGAADGGTPVTFSAVTLNTACGQATGNVPFVATIGRNS